MSEEKLATGLGPTTSIILNLEEFAEDVDKRLGRANGNVYQRKPGVENVHDGQIMVRLKKKRFIILDYGYVPNEHDQQIAAATPHIAIPNGAGKSQCTTKGCPKVGVPVLLYDSEPDEPASLYLRAGLCFSCQRNLNEKRRTQRKRKSDGLPDKGAHPDEHDEHGQKFSTMCNRFKVNGDFIELNPDAIIINGPIEGTKTRGLGYEFHEIGPDVLHIIAGLNQEVNSLLSNASSNQVESTKSVANTARTVHTLYEKTFLSLSRATFLLTQWKASWDEAIANGLAAATAAEAAVNATIDSQALDDAVAATAAALASATQEGGANMDSILLATEAAVSSDSNLNGHAVVDSNPIMNSGPVINSESAVKSDETEEALVEV